MSFDVETIGGFNSSQRIIPSMLGANNVYMHIYIYILVLMYMYVCENTPEKQQKPEWAHSE